MNNTCIHITSLLAAPLAVIAMLGSCAQEQEEKPRVQVELLMAPQDCVEANVKTRAMPEGYSAYVAKPSGNPQIAVFFTQPGETPRQGTFTWKENFRWSTSTYLTVGETFYIYGFMPKKTAAGTNIVGSISSDDYTQGATISLSGLSTATADDVCVIVGVKQETATPYDIITGSTLVQPGAFAFTPQAENNYLYVLMNHIYAQVAINFLVDAKYDKLRTIKLKRLVMATKRGTTSVSVNSTGGTPTITFSNTEPEVEEEVELFSNDEGLAISADPLAPTVIPAFFTPLVAGNSRPVTFKSTYDVYDKTGVLTRGDCTATNSMTLTGGDTGLGPGDKFTVKATVAPTYLYQLSNNDLDNLITLE